MDAQYIKFTTVDDVLISKKPMPVNCFNIYESEKVFELVDKELDGESYTVSFEEKSMREYIGK